MKFISIDSATKNTGLAVWKNGKLIKWDEITFEKVKDTYERMKLMSEEICKYLEKEQPISVYIEQTTYQGNANTFRTLSMLLGVIYKWCIDRNVDFYCIEPSAWRKPLGFKQGRTVQRASLKQQSLDYVKEEYGITGISDNISDAICIGKAVLLLAE